MNHNTTIAAISTAQASAGISVIRISGDDAITIADRVFQSKSGKTLREMKGYTCALGQAHADHEPIDECIATVFRAPHSYTGEDVVELSCHGGVYLTAQVLRAVFDAGAQAAQAGEFTKRAFLNGKLDLVEAESVMDLISSRSKASARAALNVKEGALSRRINEIKNTLTDQAAHLNAWADYPEEDIPEIENSTLNDVLSIAKINLEAILREYDNGKVLKDGIDTVIAGKPNVGKSTLMNLLAGYDKSIVTSVAGTTRDIVEESVNLDNIILNLSDTAGIHHTQDEIESIGVDKAKNRVNSAALILCVFDSSKELDDEDRAIIRMVNDTNAIAIINKTDLPCQMDMTEINDAFEKIVNLSAKHGEGIRELIDAIKQVCAIGDVNAADALIYNERQRALVKQSINSVTEAIEALNMGMTLDAVTVSIEEAIGSLCELTGERVSDEVIDRVFHQFCVGK